jgi:hypothetical protein
MKEARIGYEPIATAPIAPGSTFDCMVYSGRERGEPDWIKGHWDGSAWWDAEGGTRLRPYHWAPLPPAPVELPEHQRRAVDQMANALKGLDEAQARETFERALGAARAWGIMRP